jgi:hypothetical protein
LENIMALPPVPPSYNSWNDYIETNAPALAAAQGLTLQQAKASIKLLDVAEPVRSAAGTPSFRIFNVFTTWAARRVIPQPNPNPDIYTAPGRPWRLGTTPIETLLVTETGDGLLTESGNNIIT